MPTIDFIDIGHVLDYQCLRATVLGLDQDQDLCTISVNGETVTAKLFYH